MGRNEYKQEVRSQNQKLKKLNDQICLIKSMSYFLKSTTTKKLVK